VQRAAEHERLFPSSDAIKRRNQHQRLKQTRAGAHGRRLSEVAEREDKAKWEKLTEEERVVSSPQCC
jgi:hypothetical protein